MDLHKKKVKDIEIMNSSTRLLNSVFNKTKYEARKHRVIDRESKVRQKSRIKEEIERTRLMHLSNNINLLAPLPLSSPSKAKI